MVAACTSCGSKSLVTDDTSGATACSGCGIVQAFDNYQPVFGGLSGQPVGTFVRVGTAGFGSDISYKERKLFQANDIMKEISYRLELSDHRAAEVRSMAEQVTEGELGLGDWFSVLVGACSYIVMRRACKPLQMSEVATAVDCDPYELGKMVDRVVRFLGVEMPEFDIVNMLERTMKGFPQFQGVDKDKMDLMVKQGCFVVQCTIKWFLTTGRRPGPVVAAVLLFVANLNGFSAVKIGDVASEVNVAVHTCKKRYNELLKALVNVARNLPWGKDVNVRNIIKNAPYVMQYMEMKSRSKKRKQETSSDIDAALEEVIGECLGGRTESELDGNAAGNDSSYYLKRGNQDGCGSGLNSRVAELENFKVSYDTLAKLYSKFSSDAPLATATPHGRGGGGTGDKSYEESEHELFIHDEWWSGRSKLCQKLMLEKVLKRDVGLEALPPSFVRGKEDVQRRREKIRLAKARISEIATGSSNCKSIVCCVDTTLSGQEEDDTCGSTVGKKRRRKNKDEGEMDWEDFIIETLLLHQVKEEEIEKGYYNTLLDLYVFDSGNL